MEKVTEFVFAATFPVCREERKTTHAVTLQLRTEKG